VVLPLAAGATPAYLPEMTALVVGAAVVAYFGFRLRLVPIVAFLLTGVAIGPNALGLVDDQEIVDAAAEVGVLLLLFTIGLEFSLDRLKDLRRPMFLGGGLQVVLATAVTTGVLMAAGVEATWRCSRACSSPCRPPRSSSRCSPTAARSPPEHGRLAVSILLFQDLAVVAMVLLVPRSASRAGRRSRSSPHWPPAGAIIALVVVFARRILPPVLERVARTCSPELFLLSVIAICIGTAYGTSLAGVSVSLGAFLAGLVVSSRASTPRRWARSSRCRSSSARRSSSRSGCSWTSASSWTTCGWSPGRSSPSSPSRR
jgi:CPA2 family monovalent cation:H+ antiporter-2